MLSDEFTPENKRINLLAAQSLLQRQLVNSRVKNKQGAQDMGSEIMPNLEEKITDLIENMYHYYKEEDISRRA